MQAYLEAPHGRGAHRFGVVLPGAALRCACLLLRGLYTHAFEVSLILALGHLCLLVGTYEALAQLLYPLSRAQRAPLSRPQCRAAGALLCAPMWLAGVLFVLPEDPFGLYLATRLLLLASMAWGAVLFWQALPKLAVPAALRPPVCLAASGAYLCVHGLLFAVTGMLLTAVLWLRQVS
ncbi:MAG: hypothetical protein EOO40_03760 [Deltaproteobacteria bacterium]|nr:MAG: hypothetical protein EOO40_03760 [Deltaproteobacteria bacterium]